MVRLYGENLDILHDLVDTIKTSSDKDAQAEFELLMDNYDVTPMEVENGVFEMVYNFEDLCGFIEQTQSIVDSIN
jgi:hypothetical protein